MYKNLKKISTVGMSREDWLKHRKNAIGGSDAAAIVGLNKYASAYSVWAEKLDKTPPVEENEAMRLGTDLEEYVARRFEELTGKRVHRENAIIYNPDLPWAHANIDRKVSGEDAILECKTTSALSTSRFKNGEYPTNYYAQVMHYMAVTGAKKAYIAVLILGKEFLVFEVERDDAEIKALMDAEKDFWECVVNKTPPSIDGSEATKKALKYVYEDADLDAETDISQFDADLQRRDALKDQIDTLNDQVSAIDNRLKDYLGTACTGQSSGYKVTWKPYQRSTFNRKAFEREHGTIGDEFFTVSHVRTLKVAKKG